MKAVAHDPGFGQSARQREAALDRRQSPVKCRIEAGDLPQLRVRRRQRPDRGQVVRQVQRHERHQGFELGQNPRIYPDRRLVRRPSEHDAVAGCHQGRRPHARFDPIDQVGQQVFV